MDVCTTIMIVLLQSCRDLDSHPGYVFDTACQIAEVRKVSVDYVLKTCRNNVKEIYNI